jgi:hypothetical protein
MATSTIETIRTVHRAFELASRCSTPTIPLQHTRGETVLGKALKTLPRGRCFLSTKAGRYGADDFDFSPERLRTSLDESLKRLGTDHVDLFLLHDVEFSDLDRTLTEGLPVLESMKATGKVRCIGYSGLPLAIFRRGLALSVPFDVVLSYSHATLSTTLTRSWLAPRAVLSACGAFRLPGCRAMARSHGTLLRHWRSTLCKPGRIGATTRLEIADLLFLVVWAAGARRPRHLWYRIQACGTTSRGITRPIPS